MQGSHPGHSLPEVQTQGSARVEEGSELHGQESN